MLLIFFFIFSEENVWKLCEQVKKSNPSELSKCYAVYVSNEGRTVPLWRQKAGRGDDKVVIWVSNFLVLFFIRSKKKIPIMFFESIYFYLILSSCY